MTKPDADGIEPILRYGKTLEESASGELRELLRLQALIAGRGIQPPETVARFRVAKARVLELITDGLALRLQRQDE